MPWIGSAGSQITQRSDGTRTGAEVWQEAKATPVKIRAVDHDVHDEDLSDMINLCLKKDGGNTATANIPMGGFLLTGAGSATARAHNPLVSQVQDGSFNFVSAAGTGDAITLDLTPSITAYVAGAVYWFKATATNTGAATVNIDAVGLKDLKKGAAGSTALAAGDITSGGIYAVIYDGTNMQLLNPKTPVGYIVGTDIQAYDELLAEIAALSTDPNADSGLFFDDSAGNIAYWTPSAPLSFSGTNLVVAAASDSAAGVLETATQAEMVTGTATDKIVTPGHQHSHPGHPKTWARVNVSGGTPTLAASYNVTSITDDGVGDLTITIATDFGSANWAAVMQIGNTAGQDRTVRVTATAAGSASFTAFDTSAGSSVDIDTWHFVGMGAQ
jgi:hypothetical protein